MGKKNKLAKIDKGTRELIQSYSEIIKIKKGDPKLKGKGKKIKAIKRSCVHWMAHKGDLIPTVETCPEDETKWVCKICGAVFPKAPIPQEDVYDCIKKVLGLVNQSQFWSVKMGGDKDDMATFIRLKRLLSEYSKINENIQKAVQKRAIYESNRDNSDAVNNVLGYYGDFSYHA